MCGVGGRGFLGKVGLELSLSPHTSQASFPMVGKRLGNKPFHNSPPSLSYVKACLLGERLGVTFSIGTPLESLLGKANLGERLGNTIVCYLGSFDTCL